MPNLDNDFRQDYESFRKMNPSSEEDEEGELELEELDLDKEN